MTDQAEGLIEFNNYGNGAPEELAFSRKKTVKLVLSCVLSAFFLWLAFKNVEFRELRKVLGEINYWWTVPFTIITVFGMYLRAVRWRWLLKARYDFSSGHLFPPLIIGFALNSLLPFRAGEFARPYILARREKIPYTTVFATVAVERIVDSLTLLVSLFFVLLFLKIDPEASYSRLNMTITGADILKQRPKLILMAAILLSGAISFLWTPTRNIYAWFIRKTPFLSERFRGRLLEMLDNFAHGFHSLKNRYYVLAIILYSVAIWCLVGLSLQVMSWGFPTLSLNFFGGMAVMIIICLAIMPSAVPGYWGFYEVGCVLALKVLGSVGEGGDGEGAALGFSLIIHSLQIIPIVLIGIYYMWRENLSLEQMEKLAENQECPLPE